MDLAALLLDGQHPWGQQTPEPERVALGPGEGSPLVESRVVQQIEAVLERKRHGDPSEW